MHYEYEFIRHIEATSLKFFFVSIMHRLYHWHSDIEILLVVEGSVILDTTNRKYKLSENDIFILNSNEVHGLTKTDEANTVLAIQFDPKFCKAYFPQLQSMLFLNQYVTEKTNVNCWRRLRAYICQVVNEYHNKDKCYTLKLMSTLQLIICCLLENLDYKDITEKELSAQQKNLDRLNGVISYVKENYMNKISLKEIAEKENLDMYYLSHFVKKYLGISFQEYLNKVRLERAVELIMQADSKMLDICIECGFSDYRYLNKMFFKEFSCTPKEYKILYGKTGTVFSDYPNGEQDEIIHNDKAMEVLIRKLDSITPILKTDY